MQSKSIPTPVIIAAIVLVLVVIGFFGYKVIGPRDLGGSYTPGVPPWQKSGASAPTPPATGAPPTAQ
jgi:hypothetical protein